MKKLFVSFLVLFLFAVSSCNSNEGFVQLATETLSSTPTAKDTATTAFTSTATLTFTPSFTPTLAVSLTPTITPSITPTPSFDQIVSSLNTASALESFLKKYFTIKFHDGCESYKPEKFYKLRNGDCKDFATFASYVLDKNGYYAEIVSFTWYTKSGQRNGHVVVIFRDSDGVLRYISNDEIVGKVDSVEDLLINEKIRLGAGKIGVHYVFPAGTRHVCTP